jgi:hypothetical protein
MPVNHLRPVVVERHGAGLNKGVEKPVRSKTTERHKSQVVAQKKQQLAFSPAVEVDIAAQTRRPGGRCGWRLLRKCTSGVRICTPGVCRRPRVKTAGDFAGSSFPDKSPINARRHVRIAFSAMVRHAINLGKPA